MLPSSRRMPCLRARFSGEPAIGPDMRRALGAGASERLARVTGRGFRPSGLRSAAFSPAVWSGAHWRQVRPGSLPAATVAQGGPYLDDPSRDERPANYAPNGEQIDAASRHEPGIIRGKGAVFPSSPTQGSQERRGPFPGLSCKFVCDVPGSPEGRVKRHKLVGGEAGGARSPPRQRIAVAVCVAKSQSVLAQPPDRKL